MSTSDQTTIVVGGGIMGACTAWSLIKQGMGHVTLIDSHELPRKIGGASVDGTRAIRYTYGKEKGYMIMVSDAFETWKELFEDLGKNFYTQTGQYTLHTTTPFDKISHNVHKVMDSYDSIMEYKDLLGIEIEYLTKEEISKSLPKINTDDIEFGLYTKQSGVLHAWDIVSNTIEWLKKCTNVTILEGPSYEVVSFKVNDSNSSISEDTNPNYKPQHMCTLKSGQVISADNLVIAVNNFTTDLIPEINKQKELIPKRQEVTYFEVPEDEIDYWKSLPLVIEDNSDGHFYFMPFQGGKGQYGAKVSQHDPSKYSDIHNEDYKQMEGYNQKQVNWFNHRMIPKTGNSLKQNHVKVCYYDYVDDEQFQMYALNNSASAFALYGFSGHGFKFGALVGKASASVITGKKSFEATKHWLAGRALSKFADIH